MNTSLVIVWKNEVQISNVKKISNSTTTIIDNPPVLSSKYNILKSLSMMTSESCLFDEIKEYDKRIDLCSRRQ